MSKEALYISSSCHISNNIVSINGARQFGVPGIAAEDFLVDVYKHFQVEYPKFYKMDRLAQLGFLAAELVLKDRGINDKYKPEEIGLVFNNANASLDADLQYFETVKNIPSPAQFVYTLPNIVMGEVSIRHRFKGENAFFVSETFNAGLVHWYVQDLFARNKLKACVCGWVDYLDGVYEAVLYLVEKESGASSPNFTIDNIHKIYELSNGEING